MPKTAEDFVTYLRKALDTFRTEHGLRCSELVGCLELVKNELLDEVMGDDNTAPEFPW